MCRNLMFDPTLIPLKCSSLDWPSLPVGRTLLSCAAWRRAYGQRAVLTAWGHHCLACRSCLQAPSETSRMARSAMPYWKCAFTLQKGELLALGLACLTEEAVGKSTVVTVVVGNTDAMLSGKAHECLLGVDGLFVSQIACHRIDKHEARILVHKNSGVAVAHLGECPLQLAIETRLC